MAKERRACGWALEKKGIGCPTRAKWAHLD
jgi:hypothetical protein